MAIDIGRSDFHELIIITTMNANFQEHNHNLS